MADAATLNLIITGVQTMVITLTLVVFIFQFRSQEKAIKEASYQNLLGRYNDFIMTGGEGDSPLFARLLNQGEKELDSKEVTFIRRLLISYGIIEEAFELYKKGWIDKESWEQWDTWLRALCKNPYFAMIHKSSAGMFDREFQAHVTELLGAGPA